MANLTAVVVPAKVLKNGKHKIRISVAHNGETRYILTDIIINSASEFKAGSIRNRQDASYLNTKLRGVLQEYQIALDEIKGQSHFSCAELVDMIKNGANTRNRTLKSIKDEYFEFKRIKDTTRVSYNMAWNAIRRHLSGSILLEQITPNTIARLEAAFIKDGMCDGTRRNYIMLLKAFVNYGINSGYVSYKINPFANYTMPQARVRDSWLSVNEIRTIRDYEFRTEGLRFIRDIFMLSYYMGGINMVDILKLDFNNIGTHIKYTRSKVETRIKETQYIEFDIPEEALEIIARIKGEKKRLKRLGANQNVTQTMNRMAKRLNIPKLIFYSARKSFSQHALELGTNQYVIDYLLGHSVRGMGQSCLYAYARVTPKMATEALRKVLDNLK